MGNGQKKSPRPYLTPSTLLDAIRNGIQECEDNDGVELADCIYYHVSDWLGGKFMVALMQKVTLWEFWRRLKLDFDLPADGEQNKSA